MKKYLFVVLLIIIWGCAGNKGKSDAYGTFESTEITVSSEGNGKIVQLNIEEGQQLKFNTIVGIVDTVDLVLKKEQLIAQKMATAANRDNLISQIEVQKQQKANLIIDKDRTERLIKDNAATTKQLDDINAAIRLVDKQINAIETQNISLNSQIEALVKQIEQIQQSIRESYIINPVDGTVLTKYAQLGEYATIGKAIYKIADLNTMYLRVYVSGAQLPGIKVGQQAEVLIDKDNNNLRKLEGTVSWVSQSAEFTPKIIQTKEERVNLVYAVKILVKNDGTLKIGMPGEVNFK